MGESEIEIHINEIDIDKEIPQKYLLTEAMIRNNDIDTVEKILNEAEEDSYSIHTIVNLPIAPLNQTALHLAASEGLFDLVCLLLQNGANINTLDKNCWSPLHCAAYHKHLDVSEVLLTQKANVTLLTDSGFYFLQFIIQT